MMKIAVIGCGSIGRRHIANLQNQEKIKSENRNIQLITQSKIRKKADPKGGFKDTKAPKNIKTDKE